MSWHISFYARTKAIAIDRVNVERVTNTHFPVAAAEALTGLINWLPEQPKKLISIVSSGSSYDTGGNASLAVQLVDLLE